MFTARLVGVKYLLRREIRWATSFALRIFRIPVGLACAGWLLTRSNLRFVVTPKGGASERSRGHAPRILWALTWFIVGIACYAAAGVAKLVPWRTATGSTVASGLWVVLAGGVLIVGLRRILSRRYASSRRNGPRIPFSAPILLEGARGELIDVSVGGAAVRLPRGVEVPSGLVVLELPGECAVKMEVVRHSEGSSDSTVVSLRVPALAWEAYRRLALWLFHTPPDAIPELGRGIPVVAATFLGDADTGLRGAFPTADPPAGQTGSSNVRTSSAVASRAA